jgi:hypothetical protein
MNYKWTHFIIALCIGVFCFNNYLKAGDTIALECHYGNELGFKIGFSQFANIFQGSTSGPLNNTYIVDYKRKFGHNQAIRLGIAGNYGQQEGNLNSSGNIKTVYGILQPRIGWEYNHYFTARWSCFYGFDVKGRWYHYKERQEGVYYDSDHEEATEITTRQSYQAGLAPLLGFEFAISRRFSLTTAMHLTIFYGKQTSKTILKDGDEVLEESSGKGQSIGAEVSPFQSLMVNFHF